MQVLGPRGISRNDTGHLPIDPQLTGPVINTRVRLVGTLAPGHPWK